MNWYNNRFLPLLWQFLLIPCRMNTFVYLRSQYFTYCFDHFSWNPISTLGLYLSIFQVSKYKYLIFLFLLLVSSSFILSLRYSPFLFLNVLLVSHLKCADYLHWFGLEFATIVISPASIGLLILSIHDQTMVYYTMACNILYFLWLRSWYCLILSQALLMSKLSS
jgi:hypothetical protein